MKIFKQLFIIFILCLFGQIISEIMPIIFPANVISMLLLLVLLIFKIIKVEHIKETTEFMLANLSFFFIPLIVGIIDNYYLIKDSIVVILFICIFTTFLTFAATAFTVIGVIKLLDKWRKLKHE